MQLTEVMRTAFSARDFVDEPVSDEVLYRIFDNARFAPSGGNRQGWNVIVVRDRVKRLALADLIRPTFKRYLAQVRRGESPWNTIVPSKVTAEEIAAADPPPGMVERLVMSPVLLIVTVDLRVVASFDAELDRIGVISGASIYPFVWNILLAVNDEGLGGTLTTFVTGQEPKVRALFGMPDYVAVGTARHSVEFGDSAREVAWPNEIAARVSRGSASCGVRSSPSRSCCSRTTRRTTPTSTG